MNHIVSLEMYKKTPKSIGAQIAAIKGMFATKSSVTTTNSLTWRGFLQPSSLSRRYLIQVHYKIGQEPKVIVLEPELKSLQGSKIPHQYNSGALCLYYPPDNSWRPSLLLAKTVLPWASEWLLFYEIWLATGIWYGGGVDHALQDS